MAEPDLGGHDGVLLDLDGTLYSGDEVVVGAVEGVESVRAQGWPVRFVTNNAARTADEVARRLRSFGFTAEADEVHTSSAAAGSILRDDLAAGQTVLVLGTEALAERVRAVGLEPVRVASGREPALVQGHSPETGWPDLAEACVAIRSGALWVACNGDLTLPSERGELPGNGAMVAALRAASGAAPVVAGKPCPPLLELATRDAAHHDPLVVGDRLETDIAGAAAAGLDGLLVLSGVSTPEALLRARPEERPRYVAGDVSCLSVPLEAFEVRAAGDTEWSVAAHGNRLTVAGRRNGGTDLGLLRALCRVAWSTGQDEVHPVDAEALSALRRLGLAPG